MGVDLSFFSFTKLLTGFAKIRNSFEIAFIGKNMLNDKDSNPIIDK
jgi:hypothetical protein